MLHITERRIGYQIKGIVDNNEVEKLAKINGDLGRLGDS